MESDYCNNGRKLQPSEGPNMVEVEVKDYPTVLRLCWIDTASVCRPRINWKVPHNYDKEELAASQSSESLTAR